jgi:hypothetical protein
MDWSSLWQAAEPFLAIAGTLVMGASGIVATTSTPAPGSPLATAYKGIEIAALVVGKAKQTGLPQALASGDVGAIASAGIATARELAATDFEQVVAVTTAPVSAGTRGPQAVTAGPKPSAS